MPTKLVHTGIEPFTLPYPWRRSLKAYRTGYLRFEPAECLFYLGGQAALPPEIRLTQVAASEVPAGGYLDLDSYTGTVKTTDATATVIWEYDLADNSVYRFIAEVIGRRTDAADRAGYNATVTVYREAGGAATIQTAVVAGTPVESDANWVCDWAVDGANKIQLKVTGAAAKTVQWRAILTDFITVST